MKQIVKQALAAAVLCLAGNAAQAAWNMTSWTADPPRLTVHGGSVDSCIPTADQVSVNGTQLNIVLSTDAEACFSAGRAWTYDIHLAGVPAGQYQATVISSRDAAPGILGTFPLVIPAGSASARSVPAGSPASWAALGGLLALGAAVALRRRSRFVASL